MLRKSSLQLLLAFSSLLLTSCVDKTAEQPTEIRIVDLNGNPKPVRRIVPEGNAQMLASQKEEADNNNISPTNTTNSQTSNQEPTNNSLFQNYQKPPSEKNGSDLAALNNEKNSDNKLEASVSYDMSDTKNPEIRNETIPTETSPQTNNSNKKFKLAISKVKATGAESKVIKTSSGKSNILIQIGSFTSQENANKALLQSKKIAAGNIEEVDLNGKKSYRVFLGPASNQKKARIILKNAKNSGYKDAFIVK